MPYDVEVKEQPMYAVLNIRGGDDARAAFSKVLGVDPQEKVSTVASKGNVHVLTVGPDEWIVTAPSSEEDRLESELRAAIDGMFAAVTVVSDMNKVYRVFGSEARDLLAQATSIDLHPRAFGPGKCARTVFAKTTGAVIHQIDEVPTFDVYIESSYIAYMKLWFDTASGKLARK
jgi:sarcosine oxidase subunit gamma